MNVYFILFWLLSGAVPTEVVPAQSNLLQASIKHSHPRQLFRLTLESENKNAGARRGVVIERPSALAEPNTFKLRRGRRALQKPEKTKRTAGLEKDTDDPDGVFRTLDELKSMKPGPGVQKRDEMPVLSKENPADLRRKRSRQLTMTMERRPRQSKNGYAKIASQLSPLKLVRDHASIDNLAESARSGARLRNRYKHRRSPLTVRQGLPGRFQSRKYPTADTLTFQDRPRTPSFGNRVRSRTGAKDKRHSRAMRTYRNTKVDRISRRRVRRDAEPSERAEDKPDVPLPAESDQWWNKRLDYIDSRSRQRERNKLQQMSNTTISDVDNTSEPKRTAISLTSVISDDTSPPISAKQGIEMRLEKKQLSTTGEAKADNWLKNELTLIEIESRALKRKAAQLHNKLKRANLNWRSGNVDSSAMYESEEPQPRQDVVETYSRLNRRIDNSGVDQQQSPTGMQNIETTLHRIERKHRLPASGDRMRPDVTEAVIRLDNDLADLKAKIVRTGYNRGVYYDADYDEYNYAGRGRGRYRRHVATSSLEDIDNQQVLIRRRRQGRSNQGQTTFSDGHTLGCIHGKLCGPLDKQHKLIGITTRAVNYKAVARNASVYGLFVSSNGAINNRLATLIKMFKRCYCSSRFLQVPVKTLPKGRYPRATNGNTAGVIISLPRKWRLTPSQVSLHDQSNSGASSSSLLDTYSIRHVTPWAVHDLVKCTELLPLSHRDTNEKQVRHVLMIPTSLPVNYTGALVVLKITSYLHLVWLSSDCASRNFSIAKMRDVPLKDTHRYHRHGPANVAFEMQQPLASEINHRLSTRYVNTGAGLGVQPALTQPIRAATLRGFPKAAGEDFHLWRLLPALLQTHTWLWKQDAWPPAVRPHLVRTTRYPCLCIICASLSHANLHSKHTNKLSYILGQRNMAERSTFRLFPCPKGEQRTRHDQHGLLGMFTPKSRRRLVSTPTAATRIWKNGASQAGLAVVLDLKPFVPSRDQHVSQPQVPTITKDKLATQPHRPFVSHLNNNGIIFKRVRHKPVVHLPEIRQTAPGPVIRLLRNKRDIRGDMYQETDKEISMKEDLDNLLQKLPVSDSEKSMNSKLQEAEEAEFASTDVGRFIMERHKDAGPTNDVLLSEARFRRATDDHAEQVRRNDSKKRWFLNKLLYHARKSSTEANHGAVIQLAFNKEATKKGKNITSGPRVKPIDNHQHEFLLGNLGKQIKGGNVHTTDNRRRLVRRTTKFSQAQPGRFPKAANKATKVRMKDKTTPRSSELIHSLDTSVNCSTPPATPPGSFFPDTSQTTSEQVPTSSDKLQTTSDKRPTTSHNIETTSRDFLTTSDERLAAADKGHLVDEGMVYNTNLAHRLSPVSSMRHDESGTNQPGTDAQIPSESGPNVVSSPEGDSSSRGPYSQNLPNVDSAIKAYHEHLQHGHSLPDGTHFPVRQSGDNFDRTGDTVQNNVPYPVLQNGTMPNAPDIESAMKAYQEYSKYGTSPYGQNIPNGTYQPNGQGFGKIEDNVQSKVPYLVLQNGTMQNFTNIASAMKAYLAHHNHGEFPSDQSVPNGTYMPNISDFSHLGKTGEFVQSHVPHSMRNLTDLNSAVKTYMGNSDERNNAELKNALNAYMANLNARKHTEVSIPQGSFSNNTTQGQAFVADYFENNANVNQASQAAEEETPPVKTTDTENVDETNKAEPTETAEGIEVDVKGHKVEPVEPFAFIEKEEVSKLTDQYTWSEWSGCSVSCGIGQRFRTNRCGGDQPCTGIQASSETEICSVKDEC